jgi:hypothetical protein
LSVLDEGGLIGTVVFRGLHPGVPVVMSTEPCGDGPPPATICPARGAHRTMLFLGFTDRFCPEDGELRLLTGVYRTDHFGAETGKQVRVRDDS